MQDYLNDFLNPKFDIVSKVGYLIGVERHWFGESGLGLDIEKFEELDTKKEARIIRNLCFIRTMLFRNYMKISTAMTYDLKNIDSFPDLIPNQTLVQLNEDGIEIWHSNWRIDQYLLFINDEIQKHISDCRDMFPIWIEWEYIKDLFVIPKLKREQQIKEFGKIYQTNLSCYPFQMYIHWQPKDLGNILYNDEKFLVQTIYPMHEKDFCDISKVRDISDQTKNKIYTFMETAKKVDIVVDCENANPYKLYAMFSSLSDDVLEKIHKVVLYNDVHASTAWKLLNQFVTGIEHRMINRVKEDKSLVDISLCVGTCREHYEQNVDAFILVSSDSDYWGMIQGMPQCQFLVVVEMGHTSPTIIKAMDENKISYVFIDQFCTGNLGKMQSETILSQIKSYLKHYEINMDALCKQAMEQTRAYLSDQEMENLKKSFIKKLKIVPEGGTIKFDI